MKLACLRLARASEIKEGLLFGWSFIFPSSAGKATSSSSWLSFQFSVFPQGWRQESEGSWTTPFVFRAAAACPPARSSTHLDVLQGFPCRLLVFDSCRKGKVSAGVLLWKLAQISSFSSSASCWFKTWSGCCCRFFFFISGWDPFQQL